MNKTTDEKNLPMSAREWI